MILLLEIIRFLLLPFIKLLSFFRLRAFRSRDELEKKYSYDNSLNYDVVFEVSSDGELQQVLPLIKDFLSCDKLVLLIFCSGSVEAKCARLQRDFTGLSVVCLPLLNYRLYSTRWNPRRWKKADLIFLCRYDFYPELISWGRSFPYFVLTSASLKGFDQKSNLIKRYYKRCYQLFSHIVVSNDLEKEKFKKLLGSGIQIYSADFRVNEIFRRFENKENRLKDYPGAHYLLKCFSREKDSLIMGSAWPEDIEHIADWTGKIVIFPHELNSKCLDSIISELGRSDLEFVVLTKDLGVEEMNSLITSEKIKVIVLAFKGILCESYCFFSYAYVGGGFGISVHSLLEPFLGGANIFCGPKVNRSSEYDFIQTNDPGRVKIVFNSKDMKKDFPKSGCEIARPSVKGMLKWIYATK